MSSKELFLTRFGPHDDKSVNDVINSHDEEKIYALAENPFIPRESVDHIINSKNMDLKEKFKFHPSLTREHHETLIKEGVFPAYNEKTKDLYHKHAEQTQKDFPKRSYFLLNQDEYPVTKERARSIINSGDIWSKNHLAHRKSLPQELKDELWEAPVDNRARLALGEHSSNQKHIEHAIRHGNRGVLDNPHLTDKQLLDLRDSLLRTDSYGHNIAKEKLKERGIE